MSLSKETNQSPFRQHLIEEMRAKRALSSSILESAFTTIPREAFVPFFYEREQTSTRMVWKRFDATMMPEEEYLALVYRDEPLVIQYDARGWPISSSSMPSAMARMLGALDVTLGQRVLEIGTGTGYNAALLTLLTGNPHLVTTVEVDAALAARAISSLNTAIGEGVHVLVGDGFAGDPTRAPYDRILATASVSVVPRPWIEQLAPDGKLVMDLQGSLASGFLVAKKRSSGKGMIGHFLTPSLHFMPLMTEQIPLLSTLGTEAQLLKQPYHSSFVLDEHHPFPNILEDQTFRWLLQWRIPDCQISTRREVNRVTSVQTKVISLIDPKRHSILRLQPQEKTWHGRVHGSSPLWDTIQQVYKEWVEAGQPSIEAYRLDSRFAQILTGSQDCTRVWA